MMRSMFLTGCVLAMTALAACGEKPQTLSGKKSDVAAFEGSESGFSRSGWKAGDKTSWEESLKARLQNTQNEYTKTNAPN